MTRFVEGELEERGDFFPHRNFVFPVVEMTEASTNSVSNYMILSEDILSLTEMKVAAQF